MTIKRQSIFVTITFLAITIFSCSDRYIYKSETEFKEGIWASNSPAIFDPSIDDTLQLFDLDLQITNSNDFRYSNAWFFIKSFSPAGVSQTDTIDVILAEDNGKWYGNKSENLYSIDVVYRKKVRFPKIGNYRFEIIQGMRDAELKGIFKIGFGIKKSD